MNEGFEKIMSIKFRGVIDVRGQNPFENILRNWSKVASIVGKWFPEVDNCEISSLRKLNGGDVRLD